MPKKGRTSIKTIVKKITKILEEKKAENIKVIDVSKVTPEFNYMVIANSNNKYQMEAIIEDLLNFAEEKGLTIFGKDLNFESGWVVVDFYYIIVHIMTPVLREYYQLERIWGIPSIAEVA
jgi:ribosome-associated protein